jgi:hypothetical protein
MDRPGRRGVVDPMTDPRIPESKRKEAELPDDLDQNPAAGEARDGHGSEDAQLIAGDRAAAADVETEAPAEPGPAPDDDARTND